MHIIRKPAILWVGLVLSGIALAASGHSATWAENDTGADKFCGFYDRSSAIICSGDNIDGTYDSGDCDGEPMDCTR